MPSSAENRFATAVAAWVDMCQRYALAVVAATLLLFALSVGFLADYFKIDTDNENMLSSELAFRQNAIAIDAAFPQLKGLMLVVLQAPNRDAADDGVRRLAAALRAKPDLFDDVSAPDADPFFDKQGLLYLPTEELAELSLRLSSAQPFLGTLWGQPNLRGLADMIGLLNSSTGADPAMLAEASRVITEMAAVTEKAAAGDPALLVWSDLLLGAGQQTEPPFYRLITVRPSLDYGSLKPAAAARTAIVETANREGLNLGGFKVRLTGSAALEDEELGSVEDGMALAGIVSLLLVTFILILGLRSVGAIAALLLTLIAGLVWTAAFAIAALGSLNLISVAFAVLFVGLSVDFGVHVFLRATEHAADAPWSAALVRGGKGIATSLALCALTSAIAFFSFSPTAYDGLAELGLIAGVGMVIAFVANLTLLPALLRLFVRKPPTFNARTPRARAVAGAHMHHAGKIVAAVAVSVMIAAWFAKDARFDFDPMNLRDPAAPSVRTLFDLTDAGMIEPYAAEVLAPNVEDARALASKLTALPKVGDVVSIDSLIPNDQDARLSLIDDLALMLGPAFYSPQGAVTLDDAALMKAATVLRENLVAIEGRPGLDVAATRLLAAFPDDMNPAQLQAVNRALFVSLPARLRQLNGLLLAEPVSLETLPDRLKRRFVAVDGRARIEIEPMATDRDLAALGEFVGEVMSVAPHATGTPVIIVEAGRAVLSAFGQALVISVVLIALVLWLVLRRIVDVVLVFLPVVVAAVWTVAVSAVFDIPFNFANVIVLPLLFGLSVDFGVHLVTRAREGYAGVKAVASTTPRAVLLSALTTIGSFGSIMLSGHPGTASMGLLLTVSLMLSLLSILVFLPALMALVMTAGRGD